MELSRGYTRGLRPQALKWPQVLVPDIIDTSLIADWPDCLAALKMMQQRERHVFEIIQHGKPCNGYLDLDGNPPFPSGCATVEEVMARAEELVRRVYQEDFGVPAQAFMWLHSANQKKLSLHLIVRTHSPQYVFRCNHQDDPHGAFQLAVRIAQLDPQGLGKLVDMTVYSKDREMRMMYSSKITNRDSVLLPLRPGTQIEDTIITLLDDDIRFIEVPAFLPRRAPPAAPKTPEPSEAAATTATRHSGPRASPAPRRPSTAQQLAAPCSAMEEVRALVVCLSPHRADVYDLWMGVGWCLHNINQQELLQDWVTFSKRSAKFRDGECEQLWPRMRNEGLGLGSPGSLHKWAREDSPAEYRTIIGQRVAEDLLTCDGSHNSVARIAHKLLSGRLVCASADGNLWYLPYHTLPFTSGVVEHLRQPTHA